MEKEREFSQITAKVNFDDNVQKALFSPWCDERGQYVYDDNQLKDIAYAIADKFGEDILNIKEGATISENATKGINKILDTMRIPLFNDNLDNDVSVAIAENLNLVEESTYKEYLKELAFRLSEILAKTLGPYARTTIIDDGVAKYPTKDGWNILKRIRFNDEFLNSLLAFIRDISFNLVTKVGDGTTTALVSACNFITEFDKEDINARQPEFIAALQNVYNVLKGILTREGAFVKYIDKSPEADFEDIRKIAKLSANGNDEIATMIQDIYKKTHNPNIYVAIDKQEKTTHEITTGYKLDCNTINQRFYRNDGDQFVRPNIPVLVFDHNVSTGFDGAIIDMAQQVIIGGRISPIICIIAPNFDDQFLEWMGANLRAAQKNGTMASLIFVQAGMATSQGKKYVEDILKIANAESLTYNKVRLFNDLVNPTEESMQSVNETLKAFGEQYGDPKNFINLVVGNLRNACFGEKYLVVDMDPEHNQVLKQHIEEVEEEYAEAVAKAEKSLSGNTKQFTDIYLHHSRLSGGMGVIKVGGVSDIERLCTKDAIDDAVLACKSAFEKGYARGMNISTINAIRVALEEENLKEVSNNETAAQLRIFFADELNNSEEVEAFNKRIETEFMTKLDEVQTVTNKAGDNKTFMFHSKLSDLEVKILNMIDRVFVNTTYRIFRNKIEDNNKGLKMTVLDAKAVDRIINVCCTTGATYNLVTNEFEKFDLDEINVINPIETDIQIINAIIGFLTLILTSNQMLTLNKFLGMKESKSKMKKDAIENKMEIIKATIKMLKEEFPDATPEQLIGALNIN